MTKCSRSQSFQSVNEHHKNIHRFAKDAVAACNVGDKSTAERLYSEREDLSNSIADANKGTELLVPVRIRVNDLAVIGSTGR